MRKLTTHKLQLDLKHFSVERTWIDQKGIMFYVRDLDHYSQIIATCDGEQTAILIAELLNGHRKACREVATIHRPTCGAETD